MTAKEFLNQAYLLDQRIKSKSEQIQSLNELATKCTATLTGMPRNPNHGNSLMYKIVEIGGNIVKGLWSGIQQLASWLWNKVSGWISSIWDGICDFFGIHSPSKEMAWQTSPKR